MTVISCMVPEMWSTTDQIFCHVGSFFCSFTLTIRKIKILKKWKNAWRYYCFTHEYHKWQTCHVCWDIECDGNNFLQFWNIFSPFTPPATQKIKFLKKKKKTPRGITILKMNTVNDNHIMHVSWNKESNRCNFLSFWTIYGPFNTLTTKNIKILKT